jgi:superfamily II DNA or RNA helicase
VHDIMAPDAAASSATGARFDEDDIDRCLPGELRKGRSYQRSGAVRDLRVENGGRRLAALVQGTQRRPYRVIVEIEDRDDGEVELRGQCSCPVAFDCKHVAAALLQALATPPEDTGQLSDPFAGPLGEWLSQLRKATTSPGRSPEELVYRLDAPTQSGARFELDLRLVRRLKSGEYSADRPCPPQQLQNPTANYLSPADRAIARHLRTTWHSGVFLPEDPDLIDLLMRRIVVTGRCRWRTVNGPALTLGPPRAGRLAWWVGTDGRQTLTIELSPSDGGNDNAVIALPCASPWYVDTERHQLGPLQLDLPRSLIASVLAAPSVSTIEAAALVTRLDRDFAGLPLPRPRCDAVEEIREDPPVPTLRLVNRKRQWGYWGAQRQGEQTIDLALLTYSYGGVEIDPAAKATELRRLDHGRVIVQRRNMLAERASQARLEAFGLNRLGPYDANVDKGACLTFAFSDTARDWPQFAHEAVPALVAEGWRIESESGFNHGIVDARGEWTAELDEAGGWWFSLDLGIEIDGERVPLLPVLTSLLVRLKAPGAPGSLDALARNGVVYGKLGDGRHVVLPLDRTKAILSALVELYDPASVSPAGKLDISAGEAIGLAAVEAAIRLRWLGGERLRRLAERLSHFSGLQRVMPPEGLRTELRAYQRDGLDWLQFLRAYELGGILADDMGLGKTVQTLAHLLVEKREGRLDRPCLVVCPTSVVPNWCAEAERLAPELRVISLHGPDRTERFAAIEDADVALTTYALLSRDTDRLLPIEWYIVVLDEAQAIKNAAAKTTQFVCRLQAHHRLCLTGTPIENHLGELWSQFAFLMPGLLGESRRFARVFRNPIEKRHDEERRRVLSARLKPFMLRRTKALVEADLPPKTEMLRPLELSGPQRDLYETVRLAMHENVRRAVAAKGLARSHIIVLDALLKLRQVCCDPQLVKLAAARRVTASVKLDHLMEMLPALVEDGRRILLFSQFTSMLDLIKRRLADTGISYVELRGVTRDRAAPVKRFQNGEVPLFLISLKAGGTGVNLTAADTVIHYDPWWNPAVEDQATDRTHRIGQDKPVFVYKLIAKGTVEERMLELQQRKKALAAGVLGATGSARPALEAADIERLFAPIA